MSEITSSFLESLNLAYFYNQVSSIIGETYSQLLLFTIGMFIYAVFIWYFYKNLSKRDLFQINLEKYNLPEVKYKTLKKIGSSLLYILKYGIVFPIFIFLWFAILSVFLFLLSKDISAQRILLTSIAVVSAVRITSYYKEDLASDIAKLLPLALLAILLADPNFFSFDLFLRRLSEVSNLWSYILQFLIFSILLEWILRIFYLIKRFVSKNHTKGIPVI